MRVETSRAGELVAVGAVLAVLELTWLSHSFEEPLGRGGLVVFVGSMFVTAVLWAMLALRTLADDGPPEPEIDDGLLAIAVLAWVMVVVVPRATNFIEDGPTDDFTRVYFPVSLLVVFVMLAAQKLWRPRTVRNLFRRFLGSLAVCLFAAAGLVFMSGGEGARELAIRAVVGAVVALLATVFSGRLRTAP